MNTAPEIRPSGSSRRVEAWIYTVINPLIDATRSEAHLTERGNLSWRYYSRRAEYIRAISECIQPHNLPNLEDFIADNEQFENKFDHHDKALRLAEQKAAAFFDAVTSTARFTDDVSEALREYDAVLDKSQSVNPDADSIRRNAPEFVAEYLINNIDSLPNAYTTHRFWQLFRQKFQEYKQRAAFLEFQEAMQAFRRYSLDLQRDLESLRLRLCREFDVPAAPAFPPVAADFSGR